MSLVDPTRALLLMIDVQERLAPAMSEREAVVRNGAILLQAASALQVPIFASEQYPEGLGATLPELRSLTPLDQIHAKREFSCARNAELRARLDETDRRQTVIFGIEAHVCVLQTAMDLAAAGSEVFVAADAVSSRRLESKAVALDRLAQAGIAVVTTEMIVFEWLQSASNPAFKALSKLIR